MSLNISIGLETVFFELAQWVSRFIEIKLRASRKMAFNPRLSSVPHT